MTQYLSAAQVLFLHSRLLEETGGGQGTRDLGLLEAACARPQATYGGEDLYPDLFSKTAALTESLVRNHPFIDGNKRSAAAAAGLMLIRNGRRLIATNEALVAFMLQVIERHPTIDEMAAWLQDHSAPLDELTDRSDTPFDPGR